MGAPGAARAREGRAGRRDLCPLGSGRLDLAAFLDALRALEYEGWIVVEQDVPDGGQDLGRIIGDLRRNRAVLAGLGV